MGEKVLAVGEGTLRIQDKKMINIKQRFLKCLYFVSKSTGISF